MESKVLEALVTTLPLMREIFNMDAVQLGLVDKEKCIAVARGENFGINNQVGDLLDPANGPADVKLIQTMKEGKQVVDRLPDFVYGEPVEGILTPVYDNGEVVGLVTCTISLKEKVKLEKSSANLNENMFLAKENALEVSSGAESLSEKLDNIKKVSDGVMNTVVKTTEIVRNIQGNSSKSNILALNASIEAARAGEAGRGFSVVADEMGKLAKVSGESTKTITEMLSDVFGRIEDIIKEIEEIAKVAEKQVESVEKMTESLEQIDSEAKELEKAVHSS